jgi:hypothetical protein
MSDLPVILFDEVYLATVWFYYGVDFKNVQEHLKKDKNVKYEDKSSEGKCATVTLDNDDTFFILYVKKKRDIETLSHELIHLVFHIFDYAKIPINDENQEIFALYHDYWFRRIKKIMRNENNNK